VFCSINGRQLFSFTKGIRVISDLDGNITEIVGCKRQIAMQVFSQLQM